MDEFPPCTPHIQDLDQYSQEYYDSRDVYIATLQRILNALIGRSTVIMKLCEKLQRDNNGNIVINAHPIYANGVYLQDNQGHNGVMTENGEGRGNLNHI